MNKIDLNNRVAIVTGGAQGFGFSMVERFSESGATVIIWDKDKSLMDSLSLPKNTHIMQVDITAYEDVENTTNEVLKKFNSIDILVNNAAKFIFGAVEDVSQEQWEDILKVNVIGYATCVKEALPHLKKSEKSAVVNLASVSSIIAGPKFVPYNTSKGAVLMLTRSLSVDLAEYGIRVNAVCPGSIHTSATYKHIEHMGTDVEKTLKEFQEGSLLKRQGRPEEVAKAVLFLASHEDSSFITGENIIVDGGLIYT